MLLTFLFALGPNTLEASSLAKSLHLIRPQMFVSRTMTCHVCYRLELAKASRAWRMGVPTAFIMDKELHLMQDAAAIQVSILSACSGIACLASAWASRPIRCIYSERLLHNCHGARKALKHAGTTKAAIRSSACLDLGTEQGDVFVPVCSGSLRPRVCTVAAAEGPCRQP